MKRFILFLCVLTMILPTVFLSSCKKDEKPLGTSAVDTEAYFASKQPNQVTNLRLPSVFANGMVLQQNQPINIYGEAKNGSAVNVYLDGTKYETASDEKSGAFIVQIPAQKASFDPHVLSVESGDKIFEYTDVLIGEVFYCGGQSNMELRMDNAEWYKDYYTKQFDSFTDNENIRQFLTPIGSSDTVQFDCGGEGWDKAVKGNFGDFSPLAYLFALEVYESRNIPVGLVMCSGGGSAIQSWLSAYDQKTGIDRATEGDKHKAYLYNKMVAPLLPYSYSAVLWYQGETNAVYKESDKYEKLLCNLVNSYRRELYAPSMPFYICELAAFDGGDHYTLVRQSQVRATNSLTNAYLISNFDLGERSDVHPRSKDKLAKRILNTYLAVQYGEKTDYLAPTLASAQVQGEKIILKFDNVGEGLCTKGEKVLGFRIAGEDKIYKDADAVIVSKDTVELTSKDVPAPLTVRFNYKAVDIGDLYNSYGLQPFLFRTDDYEITVRGKFIVNK